MVYEVVRWITIGMMWVAIALNIWCVRLNRRAYKEYVARLDLAEELLETARLLRQQAAEKWKEINDD